MQRNAKLKEQVGKRYYIISMAPNEDINRLIKVSPENKEKKKMKCFAVVAS